MGLKSCQHKAHLKQIQPGNIKEHDVFIMTHIVSYRDPSEQMSVGGGEGVSDKLLFRSMLITAFCSYRRTCAHQSAFSLSVKGQLLYYWLFKCVTVRSNTKQSLLLHCIALHCTVLYCTVL